MGFGAINRTPAPVTPEAVMQYLIEKGGLSPGGAAGAAGNIFAESSFNPHAWNAPEEAYGLAQWRDGRLAALHEYAGFGGPQLASNPRPDVPWQTQADFMIHELQGADPQAAKIYAALQRQDITPAEAAALFDQHFERSSGEHRQRRINAANRYAGNPLVSDPEVAILDAAMNNPSNPQGATEADAVINSFLAGDMEQDDGGVDMDINAGLRSLSMALGQMAQGRPVNVAALGEQADRRRTQEEAEADLKRSREATVRYLAEQPGGKQLAAMVAQGTDPKLAMDLFTGNQNRALQERRVVAEEERLEHAKAVDARDYREGVRRFDITQDNTAKEHQFRVDQYNAALEQEEVKGTAAQTMFSDVLREGGNSDLADQIDAMDPSAFADANMVKMMHEMTMGPNAEQKLTATQKEYAQAVAQGYQGTLTDWMDRQATARTRASAAAGADAAALNREYTRYSTESAPVLEAAEGAVGILPEIQRMELALQANPDVQTGPLSAVFQPLFDVMNELGVFKDGRLVKNSITKAEVNAIASKVAPMLRIAGTGTLSDKDMEMLRNSFASATNTREANLAILGAFRKIAQRSIARGDFYRDEFDRTGSVKGVPQTWNKMVQTLDPRTSPIAYVANDMTEDTLTRALSTSANDGGVGSVGSVIYMREADGQLSPVTITQEMLDAYRADPSAAVARILSAR